MTDAPTAVTKVAQDLTAILDLAATLDDQAVHKANDPLMPGGLSMVALAGVASLEAWEHQYETLEARGRADHVADEDDSWEPPLQSLTFWSEQWRVEHNRESDRRPTLASEAAFIRTCLDWAWDNELHFQDFAADIRKARRRLEDLVNAGKRNQRGVQCFDCQVDLVRHSHDRKVLTRCDGHSGLCRWPHRLCEHDRGGLRDEWLCPSCERKYGLEDYMRAVQWAHFIHADFLPIDKCAERTEVKAGTIKVWANRGKVAKRRDPDSGRMTYNVADVQACAGESAEEAS